MITEHEGGGLVMDKQERDTIRDALIGGLAANNEELMGALHYRLGGLSEQQTTMRLGMVMQSMEEWRKLHPDANDEQLGAAALRFGAHHKNPTGWRGLFKAAGQLRKLMERTDLGTDL
jgi:hypothetical protein